VSRRGRRRGRVDKRQRDEKEEEEEKC